MKNKETKSEEFADKLLKNIRMANETYPNSEIEKKRKNQLKKVWKQKGYIKKSREEEIKEELKKPYLVYEDGKGFVPMEIQKKMELYQELIKILEKKLEG